jgi:uncharacterized protein YjdB
VEPEDAADKTVTWSSGNQVVATVDSTGLVRGIVASATAVTITATANDGSGVSGTVEVTVTLPSGYTEVTSIIATPSPSPIPSPLYPGDNFTISTVVDPSNATDKEVIWSVQPAGIVGLSTNTGSSITVTGVAAGTATITATATGGVDITDTVLVTVTATPSSESEFEGTWKHSMDVLNAVFVITGNNWSFTSSAPEEYNVAPGPLAGTFTADDTSITFTATSGGSGSWTQPYTFETSWSNEEVMRLYSSTSGNMLTRLLGQFIKQ